ncbi:MAG: hypothetical protein H0W48_05715 [Methylibium sp.]|nr:hypothetical protein [Methylibium sp.]MBA3623941.1 hypothetical protein [Methylibium sp.]
MEVLLALATLLGGAAALWYFKDKALPPRDHAPTRDDLASLEAKIDRMLEAEKKPPGRSVAAEAVAPPKQDALTERFEALSSDRQRLLSRLDQLAVSRGVPTEGSDASALLAALRLPKPINEAIDRVLGFTSDLERRSLPDIQHSSWVTTMTDACVEFLDMLIRNSARKSP